MKKGELVQRYNELNAVKDLTGVQLLYAVKRNKDILKPIVDQLHHSVLIPASDDYIKYEEEVMKLTGDESAIKDLMTVNKDVIDKRNVDIKEYNKIMLTDYDEPVKVFYIPLSIAPSTQEQFDAISFMIKDITEEQETSFNELFKDL